MAQTTVLSQTMRDGERKSTCCGWRSVVGKMNNGQGQVVTVGGRVGVYKGATFQGWGSRLRGDDEEAVSSEGGEEVRA